MQWSQIFVQNRVFCLPHLHSTPPLGGFPSEYRHPVWHGKTRMAWLPERKNFKDIFIRFDATHERDGHILHTHTQTHTAWRHRLHLCIAKLRCMYVLANHWQTRSIARLLCNSRSCIFCRRAAVPEITLASCSRADPRIVSRVSGFVCGVSQPRRPELGYVTFAVVVHYRCTLTDNERSRLRSRLKFLIQTI